MLRHSCPLSSAAAPALRPAGDRAARPRVVPAARREIQAQHGPAFGAAWRLWPCALAVACLAASLTGAAAEDPNPFAEEPSDPEGITRLPNSDEKPNGGWHSAPTPQKTDPPPAKSAPDEKSAEAKAANSPGNGDQQPAANGAALVEALADWIHLIEYNDLKAAQEHWARDPKAIKALADNWALLRSRHQKFNYRDWLTGEHGRPNASAIGEGVHFRVGGCHDAGCLHTHWEKTSAGWRIVLIVQCD